MVAAAQTGPVPFTSDDYRARMARAVEQAEAAGLDGVVVAPGADLVWLSGYRPTAITERLTLLVLSSEQPPTLVVPVLERPDAEAAEGAKCCRVIDWADGTDPYPVVSSLLKPDGRFGISDSAWSIHLLGMQRAAPRTTYGALSETLPMLRAVKDANELGRLTLAGEAADATYSEIVGLRFAGRRETEVAADKGSSRAPSPTSSTPPSPAAACGRPRSSWSPTGRGSGSPREAPRALPGSRAAA